LELEENIEFEEDLGVGGDSVVLETSLDVEELALAALVIW